MNQRKLSTPSEHAKYAVPSARANPGRSDVGRDLGEAGDEALLVATRSGDMTAFAELFARHHRAALITALREYPAQDADDLVSEAFACVLRTLRAGGGPHTAFRPYVVATVRNVHLNRQRRLARETPADDLDSPTPPLEKGHEERHNRVQVAAALRTLPERWRQVLWLTTVEERGHREVAGLMGLSTNAVAALAFRAREGLREAYLSLHLQAVDAPRCRATIAALPALVRNRLSVGQRTQLADHFRECPRCTEAHRDLQAVNHELSGPP